MITEPKLGWTTELGALDVARPFNHALLCDHDAPRGEAPSGGASFEAHEV